MLPLTIGDLLISGLIFGYGQKFGSKLETIQDMSKMVLENLPIIVQASQELQLGLHARLEELKYRPKLYEKLTIDLSTARTKEKFDVAGTYMIAQEIDGELEVRFNEQDSDPVTVNVDNRIYQINFDCLYVTNTAQAGKSVTLLIGKGEFAGSSITSMSVNAQTVGVYLQPEWSAKIGTDKTFQAVGANVSSGGYAYVLYTVPAGKTLYLTQTSFRSVASAPADRNNNQMCDAGIQDTTTSVILVRQGGNGGGFASFPKPLVIPSTHQVRIELGNFANHNTELCVTAFGYEV